MPLKRATANGNFEIFHFPRVTNDNEFPVKFHIVYRRSQSCDLFYFLALAVS